MNNTTNFFEPAFLYIPCATISCVCNCFIIFIIVRERKLLKKSSFHIGLSLGDLMDNLALLTEGIYKYVHSSHSRSYLIVHPSYCMTNSAVPVVLLGMQIPGAMYYLVGLEMILAILFYKWFSENWTNRITWRLTVTAYFLCFFYLSLAFVISFTSNVASQVSVTCEMTDVLGLTYTYCSYIISTGGVIFTIVGASICAIAFRKRKNTVVNISNSMKTKMEQQAKQSTVMCLLALMEFGWNTVPNILFHWCGYLEKERKFHELFYLKLISSVCSVLIYILFDKEFRTKFFKTFRICKHKFNETSQVINIDVQEFPIHSEK